MQNLRKIKTYLTYDLPGIIGTKLARRFKPLHRVYPPDRVDPDVMLVFCPFWQITYPSIGMAYRASQLSHSGFSVKIIDLNLFLYHQNRIDKEYWKTHWYKLETIHSIIDTNHDVIDQIAAEISESTAKVIGFSTFEINLLFSIELAKKIKSKNPEKFIVFGGMGVYTEANRSLL